MLSIDDNVVVQLANGNKYTILREIARMSKVISDATEEGHGDVVIRDENVTDALFKAAVDFCTRHVNDAIKEKPKDGGVIVKEEEGAIVKEEEGAIVKEEGKILSPFDPRAPKKEMFDLTTDDNNQFEQFSILEQMMLLYVANYLNMDRLYCAICTYNSLQLCAKDTSEIAKIFTGDANARASDEAIADILQKEPHLKPQ